jgi:hypothetical protein
MATEVVHDNHIARQQGRNQDLLNIDAEAFAIDWAVEKPGCFDAVVPQSGDKGHNVPMPEWSFGHQPLALQRPASQWRHVGFGPGLVDEDQACGINPSLIAFPLPASTGDVGSSLFAGVQRFF